MRHLLFLQSPLFSRDEELLSAQPFLMVMLDIPHLRLFETLVEEPPTRKCECCWHNTLRDAGVTNIGNADEHSKSWREAGKPYWRRRLIIGSDYKGEFSFDVLEYVGTGKEESEPAKSQA
jgi:hypothetical protein